MTRHADIQDVERRNELFHNGDRATTLTTIEADHRVREMNAGSPHQIRTLVHMDNPDHFAYRRLTQGAFSPQRIRGLEPRIREIARATVDRMADHGGRCDFARDVSFLYPLRVIMELMGVPQSDEPLMLKLTQELFGNTDPELNQSRKIVSPTELAESVQRTFAEFISYFEAVTEDRRLKPREDLASLIANAQLDGKSIGHFEAMSYYVIVATAGHDTTSHSTSGGVWALAENPRQFARLKADPGLIGGHVDESIRWETPVKHFMRTATADAELAGQQISKGDWLMLCYPSANRDEAVFETPFAYDIARSPNRHLAFGYGAHLCLGQHLGRMEMRILWEELLPRLSSLELDGPPTRSRANFVCGPKSVPIRFKMN